MWVATGPAAEIVDWAQTVESGGDSESWAPALISTGEAASRLGVDRRTVTNWCESGKLTAQRTPGGHWRIPESALDKLT
jgi:excisionase family DNA binding protein